MAMYLTISEGPRAEMALPVLATGDERIVRAVLEVFATLIQEAGERQGALTLSRRQGVPALARRLHLTQDGGTPSDER
jgi:hypothetical protein